MKKLLTLLALVFVWSANAQTTKVYIPDANFVTYLQNIVPAAMTGDSLNTSSTLVTTSTHTINIRSKNISDVTGVQYFTSLTNFDCSQNTISTIPALSNTVQNLRCSNNYIATLPTLPTSLHYLYCDTNRIANLPTLPNSLNLLFCGFNQLTNLPAFPTTLYDVYCCGNYITVLPTLPNSLVYLNCTENSLTSVPSLPNNIITVYLGNNNLTSLPSLPHALRNFSCDYNNITTLPPLPSSLQWFICFNNSITNLPPLSNSLYYLDCSYNNITCFPPFPASLTTLYIGYNSFNCLPNYIPAMGSDTVTYPLCDAGNTHGCDVAAGIKQLSETNYQVTFYPNPSNGNFSIETNATTKQTAQVYDVNGRIVLTQAITNKTTMDASSLPSGIYNVSITSSEGIVHKRIVICH